MKKIFAILLAVTMLASMATVASAASTTTLTTTVPTATYTLNIPADQEIPFGAVDTEIGKLSVTNASGFADGKNLSVTIAYTDFEAEQVSTKIPFVIIPRNDIGGTGPMAQLQSGGKIDFWGTDNGGISQSELFGGDVHLCVKIDSKDWGKALAGEYTATITFSAEVVAG